jgi:hypothetical protein
MQLRRSFVNFFEIGGAKNRNGDGIVKYKWLRVVNLMCGAAHGYTERSARWAGGLHLFQV